jgi:polyphosphate glucokinase
VQLVTISKLKELPPNCRAGDNANAFVGGFRLWERADRPPPAPPDASPRRANQPALKGAR